VLAEHVSLPLAEDVRLVNKISENLHAELLLRVAARETAGAMTIEDALPFAESWRDAAGLPAGGALLTDGSGLSREDLVTPRAVVALLEYASRQSWGELFRSTLPVAGEDGTLADRMKATPAPAASRPRPARSSTSMRFRVMRLRSAARIWFFRFSATTTPCPAATPKPCSIPSPSPWSKKSNRPPGRRRGAKIPKYSEGESREYAA
jgi:hypothetical protein